VVGLKVMAEVLKLTAGNVFLRLLDVFWFFRRLKMHSTKVEQKRRIGVMDFKTSQSLYYGVEMSTKCASRG
jgi:hypothetical protein